MILGIDIGGTTTKIAGFKKTSVCGVISVQADDPVTSASGALGKFTRYLFRESRLNMQVVILFL